MTDEAFRPCVDGPVWLQTWYVDRVHREGFDDYCDGICRVYEDGRPHRADPIVETDSGVYAPRLGGEAEAIGAVPDLLRSLLRLEWGVMFPADQAERTELDKHCEACGGRVWRDGQPAKHDRGCFVDEALTRAGLPDQASRDAARTAIAAHPPPRLRANYRR